MNGKKIRNIIAIILVLIVIIGCLIAYAYVKTDFFKTPEQLFKKYLANSVEQIKQTNMKPLDEILEKIIDESSEISLNTGLESDGEEIITDVKLVSDLKNEKSYADIKLTDKDDHLYFNFEMIGTKNAIGAQIDELHEKYLVIENRDLKELAENLELDQEDIDQIPNELEILESEFTEEDKLKIADLKNKYLEKLETQIDGEAFSAEKKIEIEVNGKAIIANRYTLTLGTKKIATIQKNILTELFEDEDFIKLYEKVSSEEIEDLKEELILTDAEIEEMEDNPVYISVYESSSKTVKTEILSDTNSAEFTIENTENESTLNIIAATDKNEDNDVFQRVKISLNNKYENNTGTMTLNMSNSYDKDDIEELKEKNSQDDTWSSFYDDEYYDEKYKDENYEFVITTNKQDENTFSSSINTSELNELLEEEDSKIDNIEISYKFNSDIDVEDFSDDNAIILNDCTKEEADSLFEELMTNAYESYEENPYSLIGLMVRYFSYGTVLSEPNLDGGYYTY